MGPQGPQGAAGDPTALLGTPSNLVSQTLWGDFNIQGNLTVTQNGPQTGFINFGQGGPSVGALNGGVSMFGSAGPSAQILSADANKVSVNGGTLQLLNPSSASSPTPSSFSITYSDTTASANTATFHSAVNGQDVTLASLDQNGKFLANSFALPDGSSINSFSKLGTVTSVGTGFGLTGGPVTTSGTLAIDPTVVATNAALQNALAGLSSQFLSINNPNAMGNATVNQNLVLSGSNTFSGATTVTSGTLTVTNQANNSSTNVGTGTLQVSNATGDGGVLTSNNSYSGLAAPAGVLVAANNGAVAGASTDSVTLAGGTNTASSSSGALLTVQGGGSNPGSIVFKPGATSSSHGDVEVPYAVNIDWGDGHTSVGLQGTSTGIFVAGNGLATTTGFTPAGDLLLHGQLLTRGIQTFKANTPLTATTDGNGNTTASITLGSGLINSGGSVNLDSGYVMALVGGTQTFGDVRGPVGGTTVVAAQGRPFGFNGANFVAGNVLDVSSQGAIAATQPLYFAKLTGGSNITNGTSQTLPLTFTSNGVPMRISVDFGLNCVGATPSTVFVNVASGNTILFTRQNTAEASASGWSFSVTGFDIENLAAGSVTLTLTVGTNSSNTCTVVYGTAEAGIS
jgi:autotransporter-associated beta strand protein